MCIPDLFCIGGAWRIGEVEGEALPLQSTSKYLLIKAALMFVGRLRSARWDLPYDEWSNSDRTNNLPCQPNWCIKPGFAQNDTVHETIVFRGFLLGLFYGATA